MWIRIDSRTRRNMWVEFVVGFSFLLREMFLQVLWFFSLLKNQHLQIQFHLDFRGRIPTMWRCHCKIPILLLILFLLLVLQILNNFTFYNASLLLNNIVIVLKKRPPVRITPFEVNYPIRPYASSSS